MGMMDWIRGWFRRGRKDAVSDGVLEREFGVRPAASREMADNAALWYEMYINHPPWETCDIRPLGLPGAIGRELSSHVLSEFSLSVSGGARADAVNQTMQASVPEFGKTLELGLCLGGAAMKPYPDDTGQLRVKAYTSRFKPTQFDGAGKATGGVFQSEPVRQGNEWYILLESHRFLRGTDGERVYVVENKAYRSSPDGSVGEPVPLHHVEEWRGLSEREEIAHLDGPLFAYFKPPMANRVDPSSPLGVSVYAGEVADLIRQADEQWERIAWEFRSGERKIFSDGAQVDAEQLSDRLFIKGAFTRGGNLFEQFSPEFRSSALYEGFQYTLKLIEFSVGLAFGTISDPQSVNKTATEEMMTKHRQYVTESAIQTAFQAALDGLIYAIDALCDLMRLAPAGTYQADYNWGDGVLDDPETRRQDMALGLSLVAAGIMGPLEYRMRYFGEDEETARKMLPDAEDLTTEPQEEVE